MEVQLFNLGLEVDIPLPDQVDTDNVRLIRKGRLKKVPAGLELVANAPPRELDVNPVIISDDFAFQRRLKDGDYYAMVEYTHLSGTKYIDVWKVRGLIT